MTERISTPNKSRRVGYVPLWSGERDNKAISIPVLYVDESKSTDATADRYSDGVSLLLSRGQGTLRPGELETQYKCS
jgi:hypothetical protein